MRTANYNPSPIEIAFAKAIESLQNELEKAVGNQKIKSITNQMEKDNPMITLHLEDTDGDPHELVIKLIQKPDQF
jgi:hypothetical protein